MIGCRGLLRDDEDGEDVCHYTRHEAGEDDYKEPQEAQKHGVNVEVFPQSSANPREHLVGIAPIKLFVCHGDIIANFNSETWLHYTTKLEPVSSRTIDRAPCGRARLGLLPLGL